MSDEPIFIGEREVEALRDDLFRAAMTPESAWWWNEGVKARRAGRSHLDNPHAPGAAMHEHWLRGWVDAADAAVEPWPEAP